MGYLAASCLAASSHCVAASSLVRYCLAALCLVVGWLAANCRVVSCLAVLQLVPRQYYTDSVLASQDNPKNCGKP